MYKFIKFLQYFFSYIIFLYFCFSLYKILITVAPDFQEYYNSSIKLKEIVFNYVGKPIYLGYPLLASMFFLPLASIQYFTSQAVFIFLSVSGIFVILFYKFKILSLKIKFVDFVFILALIFLSFPVKFTLGMGQINLISSMFLILNYYFYKKNKVLKSGIFLGLSIWTKPIFALMLIFYILRFKKNYKLISSTVIFLLLIFIIGIFTFGLNNVLSTFYVVPTLLNFNLREIYFNQGIMGFVARLIDNNLIRAGISFITGAVIFLITILKSIKNKNEDLQFSLFIIAILLFNPLSWQHHFSFLIFPFLTVFYYIKKAKSNNLILWFWLSYILISLNIKNPSFFFEYPINLILSHVFYGSLILYVLILILFKRV